MMRIAAKWRAASVTVTVTARGRTNKQTRHVRPWLELIVIPVMIVWIVVVQLIALCSASPKATLCEKELPLSFTPAQKSQICKGVSGKGAAICAKDAKSILKMKFDDIYMLCHGTHSAAPVECYQSLTMKQRNSIGMELCAGASNSIAADCWKEISLAKATRKLPEANTLQFCTSIDDAGPIQCVKTSVSQSVLNPLDALDACLYAILPVENDVSTSEVCLESLKKDIQPSLGMEATDVVQFCHAITTPSSTAPQDCFHNISGRSDTSKLLTPAERLQLCWDSDSTDGPAECVDTVKQLRLHIGTATAPGLSSTDIVQLCMHAISGGPARCYNTAKHISLPRTISTPSADIRQVKMQMCARAPNDGPARCFRRALGAFKASSAAMHTSPYLPSIRVPPDQDTEVYYATALCLAAVSEGPADCATKAATWLSHDEKLHLCGGDVPAHRAQEPLRCIEAVSNSQIAKRMKNSPRKCLGYFLGNLVADTELKSRYFLLNMCSFAGSDFPLAAAECFRTAPSVLDHDTAVQSVCTNHSQVDASSSGTSSGQDSPIDEEDSFPSGTTGRNQWELKYDPQALSSCVQLLPSDWSGEDKALLCSRVNSTTKAEVVVTCALDVHHTARLLSKHDAARVCAEAVSEDGDEPVPARGGYGGGTSRRVGGTAACVRHAFTDVVSSSAKAEPDVDLIVEVCRTAQKGSSGSCVAQFSTKSKLKMLERNALLMLCSSPYGLARKSCIHYVYTHRGKRSSGRSSSPLTADDVKYCLSEDPIVTDIRVARFHAADNQVEAMAGKWFSVEVVMIDQWGQTMDGVNGVRLLASINENNEQGAVLWGLRTNTSVNGRVQFSHLVISQPGPVEFKISAPLSVDPNEISRPPTAVEQRRRKGQTLLITKMTVVENPIMQQSEGCLFVFDMLHSPYVRSQLDIAQWTSAFPFEVGMLPVQYYGKILSCRTTLDIWSVQVEMLPMGESHIRYRFGIDAVWTGKGLPREEMTYAERLGIDEDTSDLKIIRRAYHKKSLQWHPDRWAALTGNTSSYSSEVYILAVSGAFELIAEAYKGLTDQIEANSDDSNRGKKSDSGGDEHRKRRPEPNPFF